VITKDKETMVEQNLGLVHSCANRFRGRGIEYDDLFQAGCMGLVKATAAFDEGRGVMFSTYAVPVILGEIRRLFRDGGTVKVSRSIKELGIKAARVREQLSTALGRDATVSEVAAVMERTPGEVAEALAATTPPVSLTGSEEEGGGQIDLPVDSPEELLSNILALKQAMARMEDRDRQLIILRYYQNQTQTQTAQQLGMTQVQVSRREKKLMQYFRQALAD
jgi:RNA polymerase sporulation-specific sigma factor